MQYEIKYKFEGVIGTYYIPLKAQQDLLPGDIKYSAQMAVAKFLGTSHFDIIAIHKCV